MWSNKNSSKTVISNITGSGIFSHEKLGPVKYTVRTSARRVVARWRSDMLHLTLPPHMTSAEVAEVLRQMQSKLLARRPQNAPFAFGDILDYADFTVKILPIDDYGHRCSVHQTSRSEFEIRMDADTEIGSPETIKAISNAMRGIAKIMGPVLLLPRAKELADEVGRHPLAWELTSGVRILGHCNSKGIIALSYALVFLPGHLRDYIIYHELAHLSEMNHSAAFHKICNQYCKGNERRYITELKSFRFPVL